MSDAILPRPASLYVRSDETFESIGRRIEDHTFGKPAAAWWLAVAGSLGLIGLLVLSVVWLLWEGVGVWGNNVPVTWALDIVGYDFWIGVATGSLGLSVLLLLCGQSWRNGVSRIAETVAVLAAAAAAVYPIIHLGRPWFFYWNLPYPNTLALWPQFRSPLYWDAVDILSYLAVSLTFWYVGLLPDLASLRDRAVDRLRNGETGDAPGARRGGFARRRAQIYGVAALGWRGSASHWQRWSHALRTIGLLGVLVVMSLQTGAAVMFAGTLEPGWHDTLLPVSFIVGALLSGVAATAAIVVVVRGAFGLGSLITETHLERLGRVLLVLGLLDLYCIASEIFGTLISGDSFEHALFAQRLSGPHAWAFWTMLIGSVAPVQLFWLRSARRTPMLLFIVALIVCVGSFADHFMVIVVTLQHDFLPSADQLYRIGVWGMATFLGSGGLFVFLLLLGFRVLPVLSLVDYRDLTHPGAPATRTPVSSDRLTMPKDAPLWGVAAEYGDAGTLLRSADALHEQNLGRVEMYSPMPLDGGARALGLRSHPVNWIAVAAVLAGGAAMMAMCLYATGYDYVFNIGGRPRFSWPAFVVPSVSFATLTGAVATFVALLLGNRLPRLNHPAFNIPGIGGATLDRYFLVVEKQDDGFEAGHVERAIRALPGRPLAVHRVPR